ncbi:MAG: hypothetical protein J6K80_09195 [Oscillospiraceae bacterium]|nr:hypothetical protein [Oscillospiraceae bacterium]
MPEKPAASEDIQEITVLKVGENAENINTIVVPGSNVSESDDTEQQETDGISDGEKTPQNTDKKDKSDKKNEDKEKEEEKTEADEPNTGDGNQGQEDGNQGEEGGDFAQIDIAMVMTWYKYGSDPKTIICNPSDTVSKDLNVAQLQDNVLKFNFAPTGEEAEYMDILSVTVAEGDGEYKEVEKSDKITINIPEGTKVKNYTFKVSAKYSKRNAKNELEEKATTFTYILKCSHALDLELELNWKEVNDGQTAITCAADEKIPKTVNSSTLVEGSQFNYSTKLTGALKDKAQITKAEYRAGTALPVGINAGNGMVLMEANPDTKEKTYLFTFTVDVQDKDGSTSTVTYTFEIVYKKSMDVKLNFVWMEGGSIPVSHTCLPQETISMSVKNNQLSAGSVIYEMKLDGADAANARILNISYISDGSGGGTLKESGSLPMSMPDGYAYNTYTITVNAMVDGQRITFTVKLKYVMDVSLRMVYTVGGEQKIIECENGKTVTPKEEIYDDQLSDGKLVYQMELTGDEAAGAQITDITCFQSGSGRTIALSKSGSGEVKLLLKDGKTGENTFTVQATDNSGKIYEFRINIPYKHRGENPVFFEVSVKNGDVLINETLNNINVRAWSEDGNGNVLSHILATGTDTKLIVKFDGEELRYVSTSGVSQEYEVYPENPEEGDTNIHELYIYAEDEFGNSGEERISLTGRRAMDGNITGTATILVDMTVLGINEIFRVDYDVLAGEMASHVVAKAVLGEDLGEPYGKAKDSLGWSGKYDGSYDVGFYLKSLTPGVNANTLEDTTWPGNSEEEVLQAIDNRFGKGSGLATLWRCIYRNGLTKAGGSGTSFGEHDYAQGSGWSYALDGTYYPGKGMSTSDIKAGQTLTLRYTLAYGWDIGGGTEGYGIDKNVGYCVKAINGYFDINHKMENKTLANGKTVYM